ncbi:MAG TPA: DUF2384 domain-containing protein [Gammaproteobacteria bacterium]|nr:DUF2384 domain-containing protein [Gammaproteobacteria bacterium]
MKMSETTEDRRLMLTQNVMNMLESWGLTLEHIKSIMGLDTPLRRMDRYRREAPFPDEPEVNERLEHLVGIVEGLHTAYPRNPAMAKVWLQRPHRKFSRRAPLEVMVFDGMEGLIYVRAEVDCTFAWEATNDGFRDAAGNLPH